MGQVVPLVEQRELERRRGNKPKENPVVEQFYLALPPDMPEIDLNVMKLAALYTARNGASFENGLLNREARNPMVRALVSPLVSSRALTSALQLSSASQFAFLRPQHSLHGVFLRLVDSYTRVGLPPGDVNETLDKLSDHMTQVRPV